MNSTNNNQVDEFMKALYKNCHDYVGAKASGMEEKMIHVSTFKDRKSRDTAIGNVNANQKVSFCTYMDNKKLSRATIRDVTSIVIATDVLRNDLTEKDLEEFLIEIQIKLFEYEQQALIPTYIIAADRMYFIYMLERNHCLKDCDKEKKERFLRAVKHIQDGLCKQLNMYMEDFKFRAVEMTSLINIPNTRYAIFAGKKDELTGDNCAVLIHEGIVKIIKPCMGQEWNLDDIKKLAKVPDVEKKVYAPPKEHKIHIKDRDFKTIKQMLERRLKLIEAIYNDFKWDNYDRKTEEEIIFLYFNFSFAISKDIEAAERDTINMFRNIFMAKGSTYETRLKNMRKYMHIGEKMIKDKESYHYKDETLFAILRLIPEEAADYYGYTTRTEWKKKEYDRKYRQQQYLNEQKEKEKGKELRGQKKEKRKEEIIRLRKEGMEPKDIAKTLGIGLSTVYRYLAEFKNSEE